jgi:hypothetical protein
MIDGACSSIVFQAMTNERFSVLPEMLFNRYALQADVF